MINDLVAMLFESVDHTWQWIVIVQSLPHHKLKKTADTNLMKTGYLKECIAESKQIDTHGNGDSKWNTTEF